MFTIRNYSEKVTDIKRLKGGHFDYDSSKSATDINQLECTLTKSVSTDDSSEDDDDDMFQAETESEDGLSGLKHEMPISEFYTSVTYGFQLEYKYKHERTNADIMAVVYNSRLRGFVILDTRGIVTCKLNRIGLKVERVLLYPKYEHRMITLLQYVKKYNCYFVLDRDFIVKVLNKDFEEVYSMDSETIGASFMVFNSVTDELFTGGVGGTKIWQFHKISAEMFNEIKHLSNYRLTRKNTLPKVGGSWVQKIEVNPTVKHLYFCSEMSVHVYNMNGKLLHYFEQAHTMTITGCCYCHKAKVFATSSLDTTVKVWGLNGSLLHTFRGHSKPISNIILHPKNPLLIVSSSFDGTIKIWSLETSDQIYNLPVYTSDGPMWMFLTEENTIAVFNPHEIKLWSLNHFINFWNLTRCQIFHMSLQPGGSKKSTRLMAVGTDSSLRLFSRKNGKKLCTVLPPPCLSPLERLLDFCYSRELNLVYLLLNPDTIWIYTSRTDPACLLAKWDTIQIQKKEEGATSSSTKRFNAPSDLSAESSMNDPCQCTAVCILISPIVMTTDAGQSCLDCQEFLLLGLEDGRILFMDLIIKGFKYLEFKASKDAITALYHDKLIDSLVTRCQSSDHNLIQIWTLPHLHLHFNIPCALNLTTWTRLNENFEFKAVKLRLKKIDLVSYPPCVEWLGLTLLTGYRDGHLFWHKLIQTKDDGQLNAKMYPEFDPNLKPRKTPPHQGEILNVDACPARLLLSSCSSDGNIKIWEESGTLLREIILDDSLGSICFLNDFGDLLVSFQNHIFCIPHSKVCPHSMLNRFETPTSSAEDLLISSSDTTYILWKNCRSHSYENESDIYEDPSITTEDFITNTEETEGMNSYLVPYQMDFSKYFLPGKLSQMNAKMTEEEKDISKVEMAIEKEELLEEYVDGAPTEVYLSPREPLSESWSSTSFLSHTEKLDSLSEIDYPILNPSPDQNCSSKSSRSNSPVEEVIKEQVMDLPKPQEEISSICQEISELTNPQEDSKRSHSLDETPEPIPSGINSSINKEFQEKPEKDNSRDIQSDSFVAKPRLWDISIDPLSLTQPAYPQVFSQNKGVYIARNTIQESHTSQKIKKTPVKKKTRKKFVCRPKKQINKQEKNTKEDCYDNTDNEAVVLMEHNPEMDNSHLSPLVSDVVVFDTADTLQANLHMDEESSSHKMSSDSRNLTEDHDGSAANKLQDTQSMNYSQMPNANRRHSQTGQKKENEICSKDNNENQKYQQKQLGTEMEVPEQSKVKDSSIEMTESKIVIKAKDTNSLVPEQKQVSVDSEDDAESHSHQESADSPERNYLPMTIKITPKQSPKDQVDKVNKETFPRSKSAYPTRSKHSQIQQTEFDTEKNEFTPKFSRRNSAKVLNLFHGRDENTFGEDWCTKQIERHQMRQMQRNTRLKSAEKQREMSAEKKRNLKGDYIETNQKMKATSQSDNITQIKGTSENGKIIHCQGSRISSQGIINPLTQQMNFPDSVNSVLLLKRGKNLPHEKSRCKSAPVSLTLNKSNNGYCNNVMSSANSKTSPWISDQQQCQNAEKLEPENASLNEKIFGEEIFTNYRLGSQKSQETSPRRPRTSCSQTSDHTRKYYLNNSSFIHTKSIPENPRTCKMIVLDDNVTPEYRFPSPLEVRLLNIRFPQMCTRILYQHYTQPHLPNRRINSAPSGRRFLNHRL